MPPLCLTGNCVNWYQSIDRSGQICIIENFADTFFEERGGKVSQNVYFMLAARGYKTKHSLHIFLHVEDWN